MAAAVGKLLKDGMAWMGIKEENVGGNLNRREGGEGGCQRQGQEMCRWRNEWQGSYAFVPGQGTPTG